jgi:hypothetical protein
MATKNPIGQKRDLKSKKKPLVGKDRSIPLDILNAEAMAGANNAALAYLQAFREAVKRGKDHAEFPEIPDDVLAGLVANTLLTRDFRLRFDGTGYGLCVTPIPHGAVTGTPEQLAQAIASGGWPTRHVALIAQAAVGALARSTDKFAHAKGDHLG